MDHQEFDRLFDAHYESLVTYFMRRGIDREESKELAQEAFFCAYRALGGFRQEATFRTWIYQIAENLRKNSVRSQRAQKRTGDELSLDSEPGKAGAVLDRSQAGPNAEKAEPLHRLLVEEESLLVRRAIEELSPRQRRCVMLRYYQELKYKEIAAVMGVAINTVKAQLHQAKSKLKETVKELKAGRLQVANDGGSED